MKNEKESKCPICWSRMIDPISTSCGHNFCGTCISKHIESQRSMTKCPSCRREINTDNIYVNTCLAKLLKCRIENPKTNFGSKSRVNRKDSIDRHDSNDRYTSISNDGYNDRDVNRDELMDHFNTNKFLFKTMMILSVLYVSCVWRYFNLERSSDDEQWFYLPRKFPMTESHKINFATCFFEVLSYILHAIIQFSAVMSWNVVFMVRHLCINLGTQFI